MKILFITDLYPIKAGEFATPLTLHKFVIEWIMQGHKVDVIKPNFVFNSFLRGKPFYKTGFYEYDGVKILNINYNAPFLFDVIKKIPDSINVSSYDVIISHMPSGIIFANKLAKKYDKPLVCAVHSSDLAVLKKLLYKFYFKNQLQDAYRRAKKIACRSFVLQKKFSELLPECADKTFVAASGVDIMQNAKGKMQKVDRISVLTCANLIKRKNIDKLILAVNELEGFDLTVIGEGKEYKNLKRLGQNVNFLGRLSNEKVLEEMTKHDVFVLPSVNETFGMVYLEAMASGCITVGTKNDGVDGIIIDGENGFLCESSVEGIKEVLLKIKTSENLDEILENSLKTVRNYNPENCAKNYLNNIT